MNKFLKLDMYKLSTILLFMTYSNIFKLVGIYPIISLVIEIWLILCIVYHIIKVGIPLNVFIIFFLTFILLSLSFVQIFNDNITSLSAGLMGFRKTSIVWDIFLASLLVTVTYEQLNIFVKRIILGGAPVLLYGMKQVLFFSPFDNKFIQNNAAGLYTGTIFGEQRMTSIFSSASHLGAFSVVIILLVIYYWNNQYSLMQKLGLLSIILLSIVCLWGSLSRTMIVVLIICLSSYFIFKLKTINRLIIGLTVVFSYVIYNSINLKFYFESWLISDNMFLRLIGTIINASSDSRLIGRGDQARELIELTRQHLIIGYGIGSSEAATYFGYIYHVVSDNLYLSYLMETGIFGVCLLLFILFYIFVNLLKLKDEKFGRIVLSLFIGTIFMGFTGTTTAMYPIIQIIICFFGIGVSYQKQKKDF